MSTQDPTPPLDPQAGIGAVNPNPPAQGEGADVSYVLGLSRPEPVLDAARVGGLISALTVAVGSTLVLAGLASTEQVSAWSVTLSAVAAAVMALVSYVAPLWQAHRARAKVTPLTDPRDAAGRSLR